MAYIGVGAEYGIEGLEFLHVFLLFNFVTQNMFFVKFFGLTLAKFSESLCYLCLKICSHA